MVLVQPKPIMLAERRPLAPSLLSDPAFSTDPYAHPYAVTSHEPWLSSPPAGHPTLKSKSRRRRPVDDTASDSDPFHIIPPPNSPVNFLEGPQRSTTFAVPNDVPDTGAHLEPHSQSPPSPTTAAEPVSESGQSHQEPYLSPTLPPHAHPPATPKRRITLMTLLKRRSSHQPQSPASANPKLRKASTLSKSVPNRSDHDVTLPPISFPETNPSIVRQVFPPRPATLGTSTPATTPMPSTGHPTPKRRPTDIPTNRQENLDRIDELDETNPWGVALHHGGPYEAAVQAIRGKETIVFPGHGSYSRGIPQPHDNSYFPPQATGLSLNLSPGQVLPRNRHPHHSPASHPVQNFNPPAPTAVMMRPPVKKSHPQPQTSRLVPPMQSSATLPVSSRRQSYQTFPVTPRDFQLRRQSLNPTPTTSQISLHTPSPLSSSSYTPPQQLGPHRIAAPVTSPQASPNYRPVETQGQVAGDPLSSINLVSIGIGMAMLDNDDDESEESSSSASQPPSTPDGGGLKGLPLSNTVFVRKASPERTRSENSPSVTTPQEACPVSLGTPPRKTTTEEMLGLARESPPPYSSSNKELQPMEFGYFRAVVPAQPSSTSSTQELGSSFARSEVAFSHSNSQVACSPMQAPSRAPSAQNQPTVRSDAPRYPPSRNSPERGGFEDSHSVHPSVSSKSSSSQSSVPPSSRRVPKRLVMPAPLAQPSVISPQYQNRPPLAQLPPQRPTRQSLLHSAPLGPGPMPSAQIFVKAQAQEIRFAPSKVGKLKKSLSLIGPASHHPPVVTTVSFAPSIIDFNSVAQEGDLRHKLAHKRVLSKRKSNW